MDRDLAIRAIECSSSLRTAFVTNPHLFQMGIKCLVDKGSEEFRGVTTDDVYKALGITHQHQATILALAQSNRVGMANEYLDRMIDGTAPDIPLGLLRDLPELPTEAYTVPEELTRETFAKAIIEIDDAIFKMIEFGKGDPISNPHLRKMVFKFKLPPIALKHEELREWANTRYEELVGMSE